MHFLVLASDVPPPMRRNPWLVAHAIVAAVFALAVALFFVTWWLLQPGGWLHDTFGPR